MRGIAGCFVLIDIIQLRFLILQALISNEMALYRQFVILLDVLFWLFRGVEALIDECCHTS
jgi:hypothetical protein